MSKTLLGLVCCFVFVGIALAIPTQQLPRTEQVLTSEAVVPAAAEVVSTSAPTTQAAPESPKVEAQPVAPAPAPATVNVDAPVAPPAPVVADVDAPVAPPAPVVADVDAPAAPPAPVVAAVDAPVAPAPPSDGVDAPVAPATNNVETGATTPETKTELTTPTLLSTSASLEQSTTGTKCDCECAMLCVPPTITYYSVNLPSNQGVATNKGTIQTKIDANTITNGYCSVNLPSIHLHSNQRLCPGGTNSNIGQKFTVTFSEPTGGVTWNFRINIDSGYGYIVYLDGVSLGQMDQDVWAGTTNPKTYTKTAVAAGQHILEVYGGEGCCDGEAGNWAFSRGLDTYAVLTVANLNAACQVSPRISYFSTQLTNQGSNDLNKIAIETAYVAGTQPTGYCSKNLVGMTQHANHDLCTGGTTSNIGQRFQIDFQESGTNSLWKFKINMDSGFGYSVYLDGVKSGQFVGDVWAGITNPFTYVFEDVDLGPHRLIVYGGEGCCDGEAGTWQVERNNQGFVDLTTANLDTLSRLTDRNAPINFFALRANVRYFSTFLPNQGNPEANREYIESHAIPDNLLGGNGYCSKLLTDALTRHSNQGLCPSGSNQNIGQRFVIRFIEPRGGVPWAFKLNMDSGYGYTVYLDYGIKVGAMNQDVWAGGTNPATWTIPSVGFGAHKLVVYGGEGCCDGEAGAWQFSRNNVAFQNVRTQDLITIADSAQIFYFSTLLPSNQGNPLDNQFYIENKFLNNQNNGNGYCSWKGDNFASHSNQGMCPGGSNQNIGQRFEIYFRENEATGIKWDFRVYMDSGYGHAAFFDGEFLDQRVGDVWDGATNPTVYTVPSVGQGFHRFVVYGGEGCCDGKAGDWQFQRKGTGYKALTAPNLNLSN